MSGEATFNKPTFILCDNLSMDRIMIMPVMKNKFLFQKYVNQSS
jgi:hypothetical protein